LEKERRGKRGFKKERKKKYQNGTVDVEIVDYYSPYFFS
jgi:hypothetical protein